MGRDQQPTANSRERSSPVTNEGFQVGMERLETRIDARFEAFRAEMFRALWIQGAGIVTINAAIIAAAVTLVDAFR